MVGPDVIIEENNDVSLKKDLFLSNYKNKQQFLTILGEHLSKAGCTVHHSEGDAVCLIVQKTIDSAQYKPTVVAADDTDLLCLLLHHANKTLQDIFFVPSARLTSKRPPRIWNIQHTRKRLGLDMCRDILFLHAFTGCDTTSRFFGIGKAKAIKKYKESQTFRKAASTFFDSSSTKKDIASAGETVVKYLYDAEKQLDQPLHIIRCQKFHAKVATSSTYVQCKHLPPTTAACTEHSLRVFLQVQE